MKQVIWTDENGYNHLSTIRDKDNDPSIGMLKSPPDLDNLNWGEIKRQLHNSLVQKGIFTVKDAQQQDLNHCVLATVSKALFRLYQEEEQDD